MPCCLFNVQTFPPSHSFLSFQSYISGLSNDPQRCADFVKVLFADIIRSHSANAPQKLPEELLAAVEFGLQTLADVLQANQCAEGLNVLYHVFSLLLKEVRNWLEAIFFLSVFLKQDKQREVLLRVVYACMAHSVIFIAGLVCSLYLEHRA